MQTFAKTAVALGFIGATAIGTTAAVQAQGVYFGFGSPGYYHGYYYHRHYPRYYGYYGRSGNGCPPGWTVQGGVCKPYRYGPWDIYGGRQSDYGY
jgi:hypothetical protein